MSLDLRTWLPLLALLALAALTTWWQRSLEVEHSRRGAGDGPDSVMEGYRATLMDLHGNPRHRLWGEVLTHQPGDDSTSLQQPRLLVFRDHGEPWLIASEQGWVSSDNELVLLTGEVRIRRESSPDEGPVAVDTRDLRVLPKEDFAETDQPTVIVTDDLNMAGVGMRAYLKDGRLQLLNQVRSRYEPKKS
ncbi:LPS export ABC transporter periplasmic protein LptC [Endothiovibrio diazotrophicus]